MFDFQEIKWIVMVEKVSYRKYYPEALELEPLPHNYLLQIIFVIKMSSQNKLITWESNLHFTAVFSIFFFSSNELAKVITKND